MGINNVPSGRNIPKDINVVIEIPCGSSPVKYEFDKELKCFLVDRFIATPMFYPCNYGYINRTLSLDGDALDSLVVSPYPICFHSVIRSRPIGLLNMQDESGFDKKIIAVPHSSVSMNYKNVQDIGDLSFFIKDQIEHFFSHYKDLEKDKWTKIISWGSRLDAEEEILCSINRFNKEKSIK